MRAILSMLRRPDPRILQVLAIPAIVTVLVLVAGPKGAEQTEPGEKPATEATPLTDDAASGAQPGATGSEPGAGGTSSGTPSSSAGSSRRSGSSGGAGGGSVGGAGGGSVGGAGGGSGPPAIVSEARSPVFLGLAGLVVVLGAFMVYRRRHRRRAGVGPVARPRHEVRV